MASAQQRGHNPSRPGEVTVRDRRSKYSAVTPEKLKKLYPTEDWYRRYRKAVYH